MKGWDNVLELAVASYPEAMRIGTTLSGRRMRHGDFTASDRNFKRHGMAHMWGLLMSVLDEDTTTSLALLNVGKADSATARFFWAILMCVLDQGSATPATLLDADKAATFTSTFFENIPKARYTFLGEAEDSFGNARRNPLVGSYPFGRTGRSMRDPLKGFYHFKCNKKGEPVVRLVKPGKYTPFRPRLGGDVASPYEENGSKLKQLPNGKFRHIASYSLNELIALGWDGAMYLSTKGRHAAHGLYVPFVAGYDSDTEDTYEPVDVQSGKRAGTIGLPPDEPGLYLSVPKMSEHGQPQLVMLKRGN